ncbi:MAG TPA: GDSL-type esterase/lipase family protein [Acidimicrobiales bacterium]|jgi:lysophospholipase L1-like esterase|nr:GDSL-type esterase/lipase family protein [Acidimicrobiales bacterium]
MKGSLLFKVRYKRAYAFMISEFERMPVRPGDIVFLGDSITHMGTWDEWFPDRPVRNFGISGDKTAGVLKRVGQVSHEPAAVFLMIGTNDVGEGESAAATVKNVEGIVAAIRAQCPNATLYVQGVLPRTLALAPLIHAVNDGYRAAAEGAGALYVDWHDAFSDDHDAIRPEFSDDELHLSPAGYVQWVSLLAPLVAAA